MCSFYQWTQTVLRMNALYVFFFSWSWDVRIPWWRNKVRKRCWKEYKADIVIQRLWSVIRWSRCNYYTFKGWGEVSTEWWRYNATNFNRHQRHPIVNPLRWGMGVFCALKLKFIFYLSQDIDLWNIMLYWTASKQYSTLYQLSVEYVTWWSLLKPSCNEISNML